MVRRTRAWSSSEPLQRVVSEITTTVVENIRSASRTVQLAVTHSEICSFNSTFVQIQVALVGEQVDFNVSC